jgi:hypothetical protein
MDMEIGLDSRKCPFCARIREQAKAKAELLKRMGTPEQEIVKLEKQKYCPFHLKVMKILTLRRTKAERIFSVTESEKTFRVNFGYKNSHSKATLLLIIPKFKGRLIVMAGGPPFYTTHEILNLFTTQELQHLTTLINTPNLETTTPT